MAKRSGWRSDERGTIAVYAGFVFPLIVAVLGFGMDYWYALSMQARCRAAADAGALAGARAAVAYVKAHRLTEDPSTIYDHAMVAGNDAAAKAFTANLSSAGSVMTVTPTITPSYSESAYTFSYVVSYNVDRPMGFAGLVGLNTMTLAGSAVAVQQSRAFLYANIYVLIDTSQSMGIAANVAEMTKLYNASLPYQPDGPGSGCVFGCHEPYGNMSDTMLNIARAANVKLRVDVARDALINMAQSLKANSLYNGKIKLQVATLHYKPDLTGNGTDTYLTQAFSDNGAPSADYDRLIATMSTTAGLDLDIDNNNGQGDSLQTKGLAQFAAQLPPNGDGKTAASPLNFVYLVTDGVEDVYGAACGWGHCTSAMKPTACNAIKANGAIVGVIYTTNTIIYANNDPSQGLDARYDGLVRWNAGFVPGNLRNCASDATWYYEASDDVGLINAMNSMLNTTMSTLRLTK